MSNLTDESLLQRASHAGRNLLVLACLATLGALVMLALGIPAISNAKDGSAWLMISVGGAMGLIAVGDWVLSVAARRGNPNAVGVVIIAMGAHIVLSLIGVAIVAARTNSPFQPNISGVFLPILILIALNSSRKVLLELRQRGLWIQVFGQAKPSGRLCVAGAALLAVGVLSFDAASAYAAARVQQQQAAEARHAKMFRAMIQTEEREFLTAMRELSGSSGKAELETATAKLRALETSLENMIKDSAPLDPMLPILNNYAEAVSQWKKGLELSGEPNPDQSRAQQMLELGDKLRAQAKQSFDGHTQLRKRLSEAGSGEI